MSVYKSHPRKYSLHTTRSWEFAGVEGTPKTNKFNQDDKDDILVKSKYGRDVIAGLVDTGMTSSNFSCTLCIHTCISILVTISFNVEFYNTIILIEERHEFM